MSAEQSENARVGPQRESQSFCVLVIDNNETDQKIIIRNIRRAWRTGRFATAGAVKSKL
jgi:hypothetical protein